jgi:hypothetical protein
MRAHLTDEEWLDYLDQDASDTVYAHLEACEGCRTEGARIRAALSGLSDAVKAEAGLAERSSVVDRTHETSTERPRWAAALAGGLAIAGCLLLTPSPQPDAIRAKISENIVASQSAAPSVQVSSVQPQNPVDQQSAYDSDDQLLMQIQADTERDLPDALQPVTLILAERNQLAEELTRNTREVNPRGVNQ